MSHPDTVDVLLATNNRLESLIFTLAGLAGQTHAALNLIVADQSDRPSNESQVIQTILRIVESRGGSVEWHNRPEMWGIAEQRHFLLERASAPWVLYLDDDVFTEPWVVGKLLATLQEQECGFVGAFPAGLSHRDDHRPGQQAVEFWNGRVQPEAVDPDTPRWGRSQLHRAANLYHLGLCVPAGETRLYKVAWIASCILYDRERLEEVGGFRFWNRLPRYHSGEEVLVQNLLMRRWGGCGIMPSGTYYSQVPTTVLNDAGTVDGHALDLLPGMIRRYVPDSATAGRGR